MTTDAKSILKLDNPPVIETAISVQFTPIAGFNSGNFGWYWKEALDSSWVKTVETVSLPDQIERFGDHVTVPTFPFQLIAGNTTNRFQIFNANDDRVIQIQNTRFIYNWRKNETIYPSFERLYPEFSGKLVGFRDYLRTAGLAPISPNQWEVIYVNHIPKGTVWNSTDEWCQILPGLYPPPVMTDEVRFESAAAEWHFEIVPGMGRVHVSVQHGRSSGAGNEVLVLQLTARGPVYPNGAFEGLEAIR